MQLGTAWPAAAPAPPLRGAHGSGWKFTVNFTFSLAVLVGKDCLVDIAPTVNQVLLGNVDIGYSCCHQEFFNLLGEFGC